MLCRGSIMKLLIVICIFFICKGLLCTRFMTPGSTALMVLLAFWKVLDSWCAWDATVVSR